MTDRFKLGIEAAAKVVTGWIDQFGHLNPQYVTAQKWAVDGMLDVLGAIRALPIPDTPAGEVDGWKLVPVEPTDEMCAEAGAPFGEAACIEAGRIYKSMLAVSPALAASPAPVAGDWMKELAFAVLDESGRAATEGNMERTIKTIARHAPPASDALVEALKEARHILMKAVRHHERPTMAHAVAALKVIDTALASGGEGKS
jgi:hypothetical protein